MSFSAIRKYVFNHFAVYANSVSNSVLICSAFYVFFVFCLPLTWINVYIFPNLFGFIWRRMH